MRSSGACPCSRSTPTDRPPTSTSSPSTFRPSSSTPTCSTASTSPGSPVRGVDRGPSDPLIGAGGHCTYNPEPLADFVDFFVIGDGEEAVGEITEVVRDWKVGGRTPGSREQVLRALSHDPRRLRAVDVRGRLRRRAARRRSPPSYADVPERVEKRTIADLDEWPYPKQPAGAAHRSRARSAQRRDLPRLHPRLSLLPGGHDHAPRAGAPGRTGAHDGARRAAAHRLRRGHASPRCRPPTSAASTAWSPTSSTSPPTATRCRCRCRASASTRSRSASRPRSRRSGARGSPSPPRVAPWRMRQVINKLIREEDLYQRGRCPPSRRAGAG